MTPDTPKRTRLVICAIVAIAAILMITVVPLVTNSMLNPIMKAQIERTAKFEKTNKMIKFPDGMVPHAPFIAKTPWLCSFFYPFWTVLTFVGGFVLLTLLRPLYRGEPWVRGPVLTALAMPAIAGGYMMVPWMNFLGKTVGGLPPAVPVMFIGLIPYFAILFVEKIEWKQMAVNFWVFLFLGMTAVESFANGFAAYRILYSHPARPLLPEGLPALWLTFFSLYIVCILLIIAIWKLGNKQKNGWYLGVIGSSVALVAGYVCHVNRHTTLDYLFNAIMGGILLVLLLIPAIKKRLFKAPELQAPAAV